jgi:S-adenosylmethionine:tRNA ribosyltransferase-isomerase
MIPAERPGASAARILIVDRAGGLSHAARVDLATCFRPGDLVVANDAATLPASLHGAHLRSGAAIEVRLAGWIAGVPDPDDLHPSAARACRSHAVPPAPAQRFVAIVFGAGDYRTRTERRLQPPDLAPGDRLSLGPLTATIERVLDRPRLVEIAFDGAADATLAGIARHGRPVQYAHVPWPLALLDVWTPVAARLLAFEAPSAGFALDWALLAAWRRRGVAFATLTLAAGLSSTGDEELDRRLPFDEPYCIPAATASAVAAARASDRRVIAVGTTVVRALEAAALPDGTVRAGEGAARGRITRGTRLRVVDTVLSGAHEPGESHYELLRAFATDETLARVSAALDAAGYRTHEFGDAVLVERTASRYSTTATIGP